MKKIKKVYIVKYFSVFLIALNLTLTSCEDVIDLDLRNAEPRIVIEAVVTNTTQPKTVKITKTGDFYEPANYETVSNAFVKIEDGDGYSEVLTEVQPGVYYSESLGGDVNKTYSITVAAEDKEYRAESHMNEPALIDSLTLEKDTRPARGGGEVQYILHVHFTDNPDKKDYARIIPNVGGVKIPGFIVYDDRLTNGNEIDFRIFITDKYQVKIGTKIRVEMLTLDEPTYLYFKTLNKASAANSGANQRGGSVAPANPESNWDNDALGYFGAYSVVADSIVVEE
ncbi:MAG: DUF4249 domain-containing protein [Chlorobi bacterium]|nr:DUF4249 domain-containing protein [Chlorobiota bacterium]